MAKPIGFFLQFFASDFGPNSKSHNARDVLCGRAQSSLLAASENDRGHFYSLPHIQRSDSFGPVQLVSRERQHIDLETVHIERNLSAGLYGVGVKQNPVELGELRKFFDRLQRSDHVIGCHD